MAEFTPQSKAPVARRPSPAVSVSKALSSVVGLLAAGMVAFGAAPGPATSLVSVDAAGSGSGNAGSYFGSISANGRFVCFESDASDLVANDGNGNTDVLARDLRTGVTTLVSVNAAGTGSGNGYSSFSSTSASGRFAAFYSQASDLVDNDSNGFGDVLVRDLKSGTTTLVSVNAAGTGGGNGDSFFPTISANGRFVAFESDASDLVAGDINGNKDVFLRDLKAGTTTLVSVNAAGTGGGDGDSIATSISANGRFVAFRSVAGDLVADDGNGASDVFVRDARAGTTTLVSVNLAGTGSSGGDSYFAKISASGRFVAFEGDAGNLVANDVNGLSDVFVRDLKKRTTTLASVNGSGTGVGNGGSFASSISPNGRFVSMTSHASNLVTPDGNGAADVFVRDMKAGTTTLVSVNDLGTGTANGTSYADSMTPNGRFVVFESTAGNIAGSDSNGGFDVFVRDLR